MGLPWQGDTAYCRSGYELSYDPYLPTFWPARAPNHVLAEDDYAIVMDTGKSREERLAAFGRRASWDRFIDEAPNIPERMERMIASFGAQGVVEARPGFGDDADFPKVIYVETLPESPEAGFEGCGHSGRSARTAWPDRPLAAEIRLGHRGASRASAEHAPPAPLIHYDVAIAGAGPAGAVAAALLARGGVSVALFDRATAAGERIGETLPSVAARALERLQLPGPPTDPRHRPVKGVISAWGGAPVVHDYMNDPDGRAWRLDRSVFDQALLRAATRVTHGPLHSLTRSGSAMAPPALDSAEVTADHLVDATGRRAMIRRHVGAKRSLQEPLVAVWSVGRR